MTLKPADINHSRAKSFSPLALAAAAARMADDRKAEDTVILNISRVSSLADYFVVASVHSLAQMNAVAESILKHFKDKGLNPLSIERDTVGNWCLVDYGDVVIHIMNPEARNAYNLEEFWNHASPVEREVWLTDSQAMAS